MISWPTVSPLISAGLVLCCVGCSSLEKSAPVLNPGLPSQTLGQQYFAPVPLDNQLLPEPSYAQLQADYQALLPLVRDAQTRKIVEYRLADLSAVIADQQMESGQITNADEQSNQLSAAISQYQAILLAHPNQSNNMEVLYQLAKAYEQQGEMEKSYQRLQQLVEQFPDNPYAAEVYFRLGEIEFNQSHYPAAINAYQQVVEQHQQSSYYPTSAYMLGWSYFKNRQNNQALNAFTHVLDNSLPSDIIAEPMLSQVNSQAQIDALGAGEKRLVNDTLRIMSLLFSYQDNQTSQLGQSVAVHFSQIGARHYEYVLYDNLAQLFLNQSRFKDSAAVFQRFAEQNPQHFAAPLFAVKSIDAYILGRYPALVLTAKQNFVKQYGITGQYWLTWGVLQQEKVAPYLNQYLNDLAQYEHSRGQLITAKSVEVADKQQSATQPETEPNQRTAQSLKGQATEAYLLAAAWYQEFLETFKFDPGYAAIQYSLGEALLSAQQFADAIDTFEWYAYANQRYPQQAEAAYAAIIAYRQIQQLGDKTRPLSQEQWLDRQLISQQRFVENFANDPRAVNVLYLSMQQLFELQRYPFAIEKAQQLLRWHSQITQAQTKACELVIAHSQFALEDYVAAEQSYQQIILSLAQDDADKPALLERLAASIYQQGESNIKQNYLPLAVNDFLRVIAKAPDSTIRINAQYDAAIYLAQMQEWQQAIDLFVDFRRRFKQHPLSAGIADKLIMAYQNNENWQQAADELLQLWQTTPSSEEGRQALYVAAQYLHKIGQNQRALNAYRSYAHAYPQPLAEATEARFILSEMYRASNEDAKRRFWLKKLIDGDQQAQTDATIQRTDRSRYLAAMSALVFAQDSLQAFKNITLSLPLPSSLGRKKIALNESLKRFNALIDYQVEAFTTAANFYLGDIYHQLAKDLMASDRPKNLNALELEQYELLLEEQAFPFEEQAIKLHETNAHRAWSDTFDEWVERSFVALKTLMPARYNKVEKQVESHNVIF